MNSRAKTIIIQVLKYGIVAAIFYFLLKNLISNWTQLGQQNIRFDPLYAVLSIMVMSAAWVVTSWSWGRTLRAFGFKLGYRDVFVIYFRSMVGKYIPGKFWQIMGMTYLGLKKGVPEGLTIASAVIAQVYSMLSGLVLFAAAIAFWDIQLPAEYINFRWTSIIVLIVFLIISLRPSLIMPIMNWFLRLTRRQEIKIRIRFREALLVFVLFLIPWFVFGLSFWLFARALGGVSFRLYPMLMSIAVGATTLGFLAVFAPGGIGVREGLIVILMTAMAKFPVAFATALALGYRIIMSLAELAAFGLTWVIDRKRPTNSLGAFD